MWAEEIRSVSILVAFGFREDIDQEILGAVEDVKEGKSGEFN